MELEGCFQVWVTGLTVSIGLKFSFQHDFSVEHCERLQPSKPASGITPHQAPLFHTKQVTQLIFSLEKVMHGGVNEKVVHGGCREWERSPLLPREEG